MTNEDKQGRYNGLHLIIGSVFWTVVIVWLVRFLT